MSGLPSPTISHTSRKGGQPNRSATPVGSGATRSRQVGKKAEIGGNEFFKNIPAPTELAALYP